MINNSKQPDLKDLIENFININKLKIPRLNILNLQLYAEHYVNEIISTQVKDSVKEELRKYITFPQKLRILKKMNVLDEKQIKILEVLNKIRDEIVHELIFDEESINNKLKYTKFDFVYGWGYVDSNGKNISKITDLKKIYKKIDNNLHKFFISSTLIIGILYNHFRKMKNENVNQFIDIILKNDSDINLIVKQIN